MQIESCGTATIIRRILPAVCGSLMLFGCGDDPSPPNCRATHLKAWSPVAIDSGSTLERLARNLGIDENQAFQAVTGDADCDAAIPLIRLADGEAPPKINMAGVSEFGGKCIAVGMRLNPGGQLKLQKGYKKILAVCVTDPMLNPEVEAEEILS